MSRTRTLLARALLGIAALACVAAPRVVAAQSDQNDSIGDISINYVYAAQLGFGGYSVGGVTASVYTLPLRYTLQDFLVPSWEVRLRLAVQYGRYTFKATLSDGERVRLNANTLAGIPGVELRVPVTDRWSLKPYAEWGFATAFEPETFTYIYGIGIRSLVEQPWRGFTLGLGNAVIYAGNADVDSKDDDNESQAYGTIETGVEARHPLGFQLWNVAPEASVFFIYYYFFPDLEFDRAFKDPLEVQNQFEVGVSLGSFLPFDRWGLDKQQIGVSYRFGDFDAFRVNLGFPF